MANKCKFIVISWMLCSALAAASKSNWMLRKPTNSVTIRQSAGFTCANHLIGDFVEDPNDCRMFYLCVDHGDAVLASCPTTMLFNTESMLCDAADNVKCTNGTTTNNSTAAPIDDDFNNIVTDVTTYCATLSPQPGNDRIVYVGSSSNCNNYYICYYGRAILQECSAELHWNALTAKCDLPERAQCTLEESSAPAMPPNIDNGFSITNELIHCPPYGQHLYPHMKRCDFFIYCVKGHATLQQCPFYYFFDVVSKSCKWSRTAVCVRDLNFPRQ